MRGIHYLVKWVIINSRETIIDLETRRDLGKLQEMWAWGMKLSFDFELM